MNELKLTNDLLVVTYLQSRNIAFSISLKYGNVTDDLLKEYCYKYFSRFYGNNVQVKIVPTCEYFSNIEVSTPEGLKVLTWSWEVLYC